MRKYVLEEYVLNEYNASSKAREDVSHFVLQSGFQSIAKNDKRKFRKSKFFKLLLALAIYGKLFIRLNKNDILFVQTSSKVLEGILKLKKIKNFKIIYLIHDIFPIRYDDAKAHKHEIDSEIKGLNQCDYIICHNGKMADRLEELGCTSQLIHLTIFDYKTEAFIPKDRPLTVPCICFAGNLGKSPFLEKLDLCIDPSLVQFHIYGMPKPQYSNLSYCGSLPPERLPLEIDGSYGLIWEGSYEVWEENNYLRYNNPHKASLYIAAGLPIIVWSKAAVADFVREHKLGICIDSLDELEEKVTSVRQDEYQMFRANCLKLRPGLIEGIHIKKALNRILDMEEKRCRASC